MPSAGRVVILAGLLIAMAACGAAQEPVPGPVAPAPTAAGEGTSTPSPEEVSAPTPPPTSAATGTPATAAARPVPRSLAYEQVAAGLPFPVFATWRQGDDRLFVATKDGRIWIVDGQVLSESPLLDLRDLVRNDGEQGLLGLAFHPDDPDRFFVHYTAGNGDTVVAEYRMESAERAGSDGIQLFRTGQPAGNHNGGMLQFGPDGFLYLGLGDGGGANDRFGQAQRPDTPLGALLRFDVSTPGDVLAPPDPPFPDGSPFVWAIGLRNPWRFDIDGELIYIADVGQNAFEEISVAPIGVGGQNFGWPITEGLHCFAPRSGCDTVGVTLPVVEVAHSDAGTCSITGGFVYRGNAIPELAGHYLFSDFCGGWLRSFRHTDGAAADLRDWTEDVGTLHQVTSFGEDASGELYVLTAGGEVLRIVPGR